MQPGAKVEEVSLGPDALHVKTSARPKDGEANADVCAVRAKLLRAPKTSVTVARGQKDRSKTVHVAGRTEAEVAAALEAAVKG